MVYVGLWCSVSGLYGLCRYVVVCAYVSVHGCFCRPIVSVEVWDLWRPVVSVDCRVCMGCGGSVGVCGGLRGCASTNMFVSVGQRKELI